MKRLFGISLACASIIALTIIGVGHASKPVRTVGQAPDPFVLQAGQGCAFDVLVSPVGGSAATEFPDGHLLVIGKADITVTNLASPTATYLQRSHYHDTVTFPDDSTVRDVINGRILWWFFPGDQGPFGVVGEDGALFVFVGTVTTTFDLNTELTTSFSFEGTATDVCAELTP